MNFDLLFDSDYEEDSDCLMALFISTIRDEMQEIIAIKKENNAIFNKNAIYYSEKILYFPSKKLREIFARKGLNDALDKMLLLFKENHLILCDNSGSLFKKLQISGERFECYQILREALNPTGFADIIRLAKEEK